MPSSQSRSEDASAPVKTWRVVFQKKNWLEKSSNFPGFSLDMFDDTREPTSGEKLIDLRQN
jgi:hypothetical protein